MASNLSALLALISSGIADIESTYAANDATFPSLDEPYIPDPIEGKAVSAANLVVAAAAQLIATVRPPSFTLFETASQVHRLDLLCGAKRSSPATDVFHCHNWYCELNVSETLREAGSLVSESIPTSLSLIS
jgi:hypothetical protein